MGTQPPHTTKIMSFLYRSTFSYISKSIHNVCKTTNYTSKRFAGHNKWSNIRHIKGKKDDEKQRIASKIVMQIGIAIREGGGTDPKLNYQLKRVIERAEQSDVAKTTIENALKRAIQAKSKSSKYVLEVQGPGGSIIIVETETDKQVLTKQTTQSVVKKFGCTTLDFGRSTHSFDRKGIILVPLPELADGENMADKALEVGLDVGAEDVEVSDTESVLKLICSDKELHQVVKELKERDIEIKYSNLEYVPHTFVNLGPEFKEHLTELSEKIENMEQVSRLYDNIEIT